MKTSLHEIIKTLSNNNSKQIKIKLENVIKQETEKMLFIVVKNIYFFKEDEFSDKLIELNTSKYNWLKNLYNRFIDLCINKVYDDYETYAFFNRLLSMFYDHISKTFQYFIRAIKEAKFKFNYDLFGVFVAFLSFLNGNGKYINVFNDLYKEDFICDLCTKHKEKNKSKLWYILSDYCDLFNIPICYRYKKKNKENNEKNINDIKNYYETKIHKKIKELYCQMDILPENFLYKKLINSIFLCLKNCSDIRGNHTEKTKSFIEKLFIIFNLYFQDSNYWKDFNLSFILGNIYQLSYDYTTEKLDSNYIDFVINYMDKYDIPSEEFLFYFLNGLIPSNIGNTFMNLNLKENMIKIDDSQIFKKLIKLIHENNISSSIENNNNYPNKKEYCSQNNEYLEQKNKDKKNNIINSFNNIVIDKNEDINSNKFSSKNNVSKNIEIKCIYFEIRGEEKTDKEIKNNTVIKKDKSSNNFYNKIESELINKEENELKIDYLNKIKNELNNKISLLTKKNKNLINENKQLKKIISDIKSENTKIKNKINNMISEKEINIIKIKKMKEENNLLKKVLERISYRDLTKKILDNMIDYISLKNKKIFAGLSKRKEKLMQIKKSYNYTNIEFMKIPINDIIDKYYDSNIISHVPKMVSSLFERPYGISENNELIIQKDYFRILSIKNEEVEKFIINELNLINEIKQIYFTKSYES